jgi:hypothetical protein
VLTALYPYGLPSPSLAQWLPLNHTSSISAFHLPSPSQHSWNWCPQLTKNLLHIISSGQDTAKKFLCMSILQCLDFFSLRVCSPPDSLHPSHALRVAPPPINTLTKGTYRFLASVPNFVQVLVKFVSAELLLTKMQQFYNYT